VKYSNGRYLPMLGSTRTCLVTSQGVVRNLSARSSHRVGQRRELLAKQNRSNQD
jgi:hypothetical protein